MTPLERARNSEKERSESWFFKTKNARKGGKQ